MMYLLCSSSQPTRLEGQRLLLFGCPLASLLSLYLPASTDTGSFLAHRIPKGGLGIEVAAAGGSAGVTPSLLLTTRKGDAVHFDSTLCVCVCGCVCVCVYSQDFFLFLMARAVSRQGVRTSHSGRLMSIFSSVTHSVNLNKNESPLPMSPTCAYIRTYIHAYAALLRKCDWFEEVHLVVSSKSTSARPSSHPPPPKDLTSPWRGYLLPVMDTLHTPCSATRNKRWPTPLGSPGHAHPWFMLMVEGGQEAPKEDGWVEYQSGTKPFSCFSVFLFCLLRDVARHEGWILLSSSLVPEIFLGSSSCEVKDGGGDVMAGTY